MTQEEKQLLLVDLSARLPYGLCVEMDTKSVDGKRHTVKLCEVNALEILKDIEILNVRPILRPMSSMTEEERQEYGLVLCDELSINQYDWLNAHHFDYRNLIERGLAIEVTKENNPYKE